MAFLGKGKKQDMLQLAEELGINATLNMTVPSIKIAITNSEGYEEEFVKNLYETIIANGKRLEEFKLSPEVFRQKFVQHQKKSDSTWKDFTFEITNYLDEWLIGLEINTFQDLKDLMVVDQLKKRANASMKDHFLDNWANLKSATQIAELFDNYEDVRKVNSKPMDRWGRNDKILTYSGIKEKENRFGKTSPRLGASVPERVLERELLKTRDTKMLSLQYAWTYKSRLP
ncbi:CCHC-type domain-containing protein [Trichonephila clavipes]|nr:CCHC-type domain-containing protein [Trichonephila clavipes]